MSNSSTIQSKDWIRQYLEVPNMPKKETPPKKVSPKEIPMDPKALEACHKKMTEYLLGIDPREITGLTNMERPAPEEFRKVVERRL